MWVFLNDCFVPESEARVSVFDHGFLYGDGLFETFRVYSGKIFALRQHLDRLSLSANALQLNIPGRDILKKRLYETLERNQLRNPFNDALIRLTVTRGPGGKGFYPGRCTTGTLVITVRAFEGYAGLERKGADAVMVSTCRVSATGGEPCLKSLNFLNNITAKLEAERAGVFEGLFLNREGFLAEGSISNLFWINKGVLRTPSCKATILKGITREIVIELARKNGITVEEGLYPPPKLFEAEEAFLTNSAIELLPLTIINGKKIATGKTGPVTRKLQGLFQETRGNYLGD